MRHRAGTAEQQTLLPPPTYQSYVANNTGGTNSSTLTINKPASVVAGDLLIAALGRDNGGGPGNDWQTLSGWNLIRMDRNSGSSGNGLNSALFWKIAGSSEPASYTFTASGSSFRNYGFIIRITNAHQTAPIALNTFAYESSDAVTTWSSTAITAAASNRLGISIQHVSIGGVPAGSMSMAHITSGWTERLDTQPHDFYGYGFGTFPVLPLTAQACQVTRTQLTGTQVAYLYLLSIRGG